MQILIFVSVVCLVLSLAVDQRKTFEGIKRGSSMFLKLLPALMVVLFLVSLFLYILPDQAIVKFLGKNNNPLSIITAAVLGSISLIPGFISFPLAGILLNRGVSHTVLAVFITTLLMVGILTLPLEIKFFGKKAAVMRNILSFFGAIIVGLLIGIFY